MKTRKGRDSAGIVRLRQASKIVQQETAEDEAQQKRHFEVEVASKEEVRD